MKFSNLFRTNDVYLASYPRSGNTWMRTLMAYLYFDNPAINSLIDLQNYIPDEHFKIEEIDKTFKVQNKFRIIKTHSVKDKKKYKKVIYLYRNPIDVAWSFYNFLKDTQQLTSDKSEDYIENYLTGKVPFGSWENHVKSWLKHENKMVISYEEFAKDTLSAVLKINDFIDVAVPEYKIKKALEEVTPNLVKKITDDEIFYGSHKPNFVSTPLGQSSEEKKQFYSSYSQIIANHIKIYDFENKTLLI